MQGRARRPRSAGSCIARMDTRSRRTFSAGLKLRRLAAPSTQCVDLQRWACRKRIPARAAGFEERTDRQAQTYSGLEGQTQFRKGSCCSRACREGQALGECSCTHRREGRTLAWHRPKRLICEQQRPDELDPSKTGYRHPKRAPTEARSLHWASNGRRGQARSARLLVVVLVSFRRYLERSLEEHVHHDRGAEHHQLAPHLHDHSVKHDSNLVVELHGSSRRSHCAEFAARMYGGFVT